MLTVNEIFHSIQGESTRAGRPCVFVRLTACDLRCTWCDTPYAFHEGRKMSVEDVVRTVDGYGSPLVEITRGPPAGRDPGGGAAAAGRGLSAEGAAAGGGPHRDAGDGWPSSERPGARRCD